MNPNQDGATTPAAPEPAVEIVDDENGRLHHDPRIPSRAELDALYEQGEAHGWDEYSARAFEYLDGRREIADERAAAVERGDTDTVAQLDRRHALMDQNYIGLARAQHEPSRALIELSDGSPAAVTVDGVTLDAASSHAMPANEPTVAVVPQDADWQRPSVLDDPARLRARVAALRAQRGTAQHAGHYDSDEGALGPVGSRGPGGEPREPDAVARSGPRRTPHPYPDAYESDERRAQLARWADDDHPHTATRGTEGIAVDGASDEDGG